MATALLEQFELHISLQSLKFTLQLLEALLIWSIDISPMRPRRARAMITCWKLIYFYCISFWCNHVYYMVLIYLLNPFTFYFFNLIQLLFLLHLFHSSFERCQIMCGAFQTAIAVAALAWTGLGWCSTRWWKFNQLLRELIMMSISEINSQECRRSLFSGTKLFLFVWI